MSISALGAHGMAGTPAPPAPVLDVVVPVHNEEIDLEPCVRRLHEHLRHDFPYAFRITVADNASTDATPRIAARLAAELPEVSSVRLAAKGRGPGAEHGGRGAYCDRSSTMSSIFKSCCTAATSTNHARPMPRGWWSSTTPAKADT
ncbi:glycosyltransferase [Nonomuraea dietziae]|uniref:Cellulose synthase/poly-beta-1,6-N-acetylglucosamine synthase-like glycosyltransferase n=1 Tax=Nonomuraea dietziae TaxID=65515 RepID=A0A7W5VKG3_9ACTN|nr:glycosyltransferase [Nonomuraea dietziae]MBB3733995.1 cellulose synthase/poly-beta-1,6-N-acetylglucosamine synthase-like glycosyltransferase [Nonomuraea dietziae]